MAAELSAISAAIKYLSKHERFEGEVRKHLSSFDSSEVDEVIANLTRRNLINDTRALELYVRAHSGRRSIGLFKMEYELKSRGVSEEVISRLSSQVSDSDAAVNALAGKFRADPELRQKGFRFLISRGFSFEAANNAVRNFFNADVGIADRLE